MATPWRCNLSLLSHKTQMKGLILVGFLLAGARHPAAQAVRPRENNFSRAVPWTTLAFQEARDSNLHRPMLSRALAILHDCTYDAWAAYDEKAVGTQIGGALRRPPEERTEANKERAISYAAYRALTDLFPADTESVYKPLTRKFGYDPDNNSMDIETPEGIGNVACAAVLEFRHHDKSNQLGDLAPNENRDFAHGPYSDWTNFHPSNRPLPIPVEGPIPAPGSVLDPSHWQPLSYVDSRGNFVSQMFTTAHWCFVTPFALNPSSSSQSPTECPYTEQFRSLLAPGPAKFGDPEYEAQAKDLVDLAAHLTDRQKILAEYWTVAPEASRSTHANTSSDWHRDIITRWFDFADFIAERDHLSLDDQIKLNFALSNALMDAEIAVWDAKRSYNSVRPITAITFLYNGKKVKSWSGPGKGRVQGFVHTNPSLEESAIDGSQWFPYQPSTSPTPPSPDFVSEESATSAAAARIFQLFTGSDRFDYSVIIPQGSSRIEPGVTPKGEITLHWNTFSEAADEAGMATRYAGIHFRRSDLAGRALGRAVADLAWAKAGSYFHGTAHRSADSWRN